MEISHQFRATSLVVPAPTGTHTAFLAGSRLQIRSLTTLEITHSIALPASQDLRTSQIRWSPPNPSDIPVPAPLVSTPDRKRRASQAAPRSNRVLISDDENTRVFDLRDEKWSAVINNGSGGMGKNVHTEFGRTEDEVLVWSDFASKVTVWCLRSGRTVEIKDPKFAGRDGKGWGFRSFSDGVDLAQATWGVLAILCRCNAQDIMMLLAPKSYKVLKRVELATVDAQSLKWSADGKWIAVWDSPGSGYRVCLYTADGHLYRTVSGEAAERDIEGLGVKSVAWDPRGQHLAVGGWQRRVRMLSSQTFSPTVTLAHTPTIDIPSTPVYAEQVSSTGVRSYTIASQPVSPPAAASTPNDAVPKQGISLVSFNSHGTLVATRDDAAPTTAWIWDLQTLRPKAVLIQHAPVKSLTWHPSIPSLLLIQCSHDEPIIYLWSATPLSADSESYHSSSTPPPEILALFTNISKPAGSAATKWDAKWLFTSPEKKPCLLFGHQQSHILVWPQGRDAILRFEKEDGAEDSDDSLYEILTGKKEAPSLMVDEQQRARDEWEEVGVEDEDGDTTIGFDDTFREKRKGRSARRTSEFWESGMSEMF